MNLFDKSFRTIQSRNLTLSPEEMEKYRIKQIFNTMGELNEVEASEILENHIKRGEYCLLETATRGKVNVISIILFEDEWSRNLFGLRDEDCQFSLNDLLQVFN